MTPLNASSTSAPLVPLAFGDLQGCRAPFQRLLAKAAPPDGTPLWFAGDLINRGPDSLDTLRDVIAFGERAVPVLGNHDLHLLSVSAGIRKSKKGDTIEEILAAPDAADLLEWIRHRPLAHFDNGMLMVHAGVLPQWDATLTLELADELQRALRAPNWKETLAGLYGNEPNRWKPGLKGIERLRVTCSALTRMRFCSADGVMDFSSSGTLASTPSGCMPWFDVPSRRTADVTVVFGHWAALGLMLRDNLIGLDSGCVWGQKLSAVRLANNPAERTLTQVDCDSRGVPRGGN
ncbi:MULTISPECIES: symmetrical bis(5'-nucleosyl)-tetraphosphatase [unclassified Paraburkholderia]|uniref:symmetrical bis(5'-nucleosyl)-tetraphosphatase n=1 Tax=unclassified Paraburkholderia TaxID=2615204 RepID=UPI00161A1255|nr:MULTISPECIES: symmetrical bis(5'-nucleosyl)-tetraphosphatase [unclassified Paraburkholderia]MBB5410605.1 bis(5'-nucleosyl)-tetraphosphatase (symmetrical) [Paraburkholderia sp. HC6.4b]MBB5452814.1 bis(5'-nucleosyl)-tetraphosphatase (symmetrical) [Paraburkholderia sp. Kb1A]